MQWSGVRNHARYLLVVAIGNQQGPAQLAFHLRRFRSKDVPRLRLAPLDFAGASLAEALGRARMGLQLGHSFSRFVRVGSPINSRKAGISLPYRDLNQYIAVRRRGYGLVGFRAESE